MYVSPNHLSTDIPTNSQGNISCVWESGNWRPGDESQIICNILAPGAINSLSVRVRCWHLDAEMLCEVRLWVIRFPCPFVKSQQSAQSAQNRSSTASKVSCKLGCKARVYKLKCQHCSNHGAEMDLFKTSSKSWLLNSCSSDYPSCNMY